MGSIWTCVTESDLIARLVSEWCDETENFNYICDGSQRNCLWNCFVRDLEEVLTRVKEN